MWSATRTADGLDASFEALISVDAIRAYKPSPRLYRHAADELGRPLAEVRLISSNPFDVIGAQRRVCR